MCDVYLKNLTRARTLFPYVSPTAAGHNPLHLYRTLLARNNVDDELYNAPLSRILGRAQLNGH